MKKFIVTISALLLTAGTVAAQGASLYSPAMNAVYKKTAHPSVTDVHSTTGTVESFNPKSKTVQLTSGTIYQLPRNADFRGVAIGEKVRITWDAQNPYGTSFGNNETDEFNAIRLVIVH